MITFNGNTINNITVFTGNMTGQLGIKFYQVPFILLQLYYLEEYGIGLGTVWQSIYHGGIVNIMACFKVENDWYSTINSRKLPHYIKSSSLNSPTV